MTWGFAFPGAVLRTLLLTGHQRRRLRPLVLVALVIVDLIGRSSEHISDPGRMPTDQMGVHPERDRRVSVPKSVSHDVHRDTCDQQQSRVHIPQVVHAVIATIDALTEAIRTS
jgi:hypothetical protein